MSQELFQPIDVLASVASALNQADIAAEVLEIPLDALFCDMNVEVQPVQLKQRMLAAQHILYQLKQNDSSKLGWKQSIKLSESIFQDFKQNLEELVQLVDLKNKLEIKHRRVSPVKRAKSRPLLQKLLTNFETNFSQRNLYLAALDKLVHTLLARNIELYVD